MNIFERENLEIHERTPFGHVKLQQGNDWIFMALKEILPSSWKIVDCRDTWKCFYDFKRCKMYHPFALLNKISSDRLLKETDILIES